MCGRYSLTSPVEALRQLFLFDERPNLAPRYNIAPTQEVPIVRAQEGGAGRALATACWGLVPSWAKEISLGAKLINARAETVAQKPAFRSAFRRRRCLLPADGFYEWKKENGVKQAYRIVREDRAPFAFAGLWERWQGPFGVVESCTIVTTEANARLRPIHARMPVILDPADHARWLASEAGPDELQTLLTPAPEATFTAYPVSERVNNVRNDDAACVAPQAEQPSLL